MKSFLEWVKTINEATPVPGQAPAPMTTAAPAPAQAGQGTATLATLSAELSSQLRIPQQTMLNTLLTRAKSIPALAKLQGPQLQNTPLDAKTTQALRQMANQPAQPVPGQQPAAPAPAGQPAAPAPQAVAPPARPMPTR